VLFNDMLGTTLGVIGSKGERSFASTAITAFGETITNNDQQVTNNEVFFTGKPNVAGLGYAFLFRNYRANLGQIEPAKLTKEPATESEAETNGKPDVEISVMRFCSETTVLIWVNGRLLTH
jgi:hypothetical protein